MEPELKETNAFQLVEALLEGIDKESPHVLKELTGDNQYNLKATHPVFFGSYDWHSCVNSFWTLIKLIKIFPHLPQASLVINKVKERFTSNKFNEEIETFGVFSADYECPYGFSWFMLLAAEIRNWPSEQELSINLIQNFTEFEEYAKDELDYWLENLEEGGNEELSQLDHKLISFSLILCIKASRKNKDYDFENKLIEKADFLYGNIKTLPDDCLQEKPFTSIGLTIIELMSLIYDQPRFDSWFNQLNLNNLMKSEPVEGDYTVQELCLLTGLNFSRARSLYTFSNFFNEEQKKVIVEKAELHLKSSSDFVINGQYMNQWLASFYLLVAISKFKLMNS